MNYEQQQQAQGNKSNHQFRLIKPEINRVEKKEVKLRNFFSIMLAISFLLLVLITSPFLG